MAKKISLNLYDAWIYQITFTLAKNAGKLNVTQAFVCRYCQSRYTRLIAQLHKIELQQAVTRHFTITGLGKFYSLQ